MTTEEIFQEIEVDETFQNAKVKTSVTHVFRKGNEEDLLMNQADLFIVESVLKAVQESVDSEQSIEDKRMLMHLMKRIETIAKVKRALLKSK